VTPRLIFRPEAEAELLDARAWYEGEWNSEVEMRIEWMKRLGIASGLGQLHRRSACRVRFLALISGLLEVDPLVDGQVL